MGKELLIFGNIEIEKNKNYSNKAHFSKDVDIDIVLVSNKISLGEKKCRYFVGYLHNDYKV